MPKKRECTCGHKLSAHARHLSVYGIIKGPSPCTTEGCNCKQFTDVIPHEQRPYIHRQRAYEQQQTNTPSINTDPQPTPTAEATA